MVWDYPRHVQQVMVWNYPRHVQLAGRNLTQTEKIQVQVENVTRSHSIHPPSTWPNKKAALLTYINYKWKHCHTLQLWGWLCNCSMMSLMIIILFSILQAAKSWMDRGNMAAMWMYWRETKGWSLVNKFRLFKLHVIYLWLYDIYSWLST